MTTTELQAMAQEYGKTIWELSVRLSNLAAENAVLKAQIADRDAMIARHDEEMAKARA